MPWRRMGEKGISPHFLDLVTRWRWAVSFRSQPLYSRGKSPRYPLDRNLSGPQCRSGLSEEERTFPAGNRNRAFHPVPVAIATELSWLLFEVVELNAMWEHVPLSFSTCPCFTPSPRNNASETDSVLQSYCINPTNGFLSFEMCTHDILCSVYINKVYGLGYFLKEFRAYFRARVTLLLWNPNVHYRGYKSPPLCSILSHLNSVHNFTPYLFKKSILNVIFFHLRLLVSSGL
jgi:hypothetical protein